jgi:hypothetical protein
MVFFNMLKGEYHMPSLMGLPGQLTDTEQKTFVAKIVNDYMKILRGYAAN